MLWSEGNIPLQTQKMSKICCLRVIPSKYWYYPNKETTLFMDWKELMNKQQEVRVRLLFSSLTWCFLCSMRVSVPLWTTESVVGMAPPITTLSCFECLPRSREIFRIQYDSWKCAEHNDVYLVTLDSWKSAWCLWTNFTHLFCTTGFFGNWCMLIRADSIGMIIFLTTSMNWCSGNAVCSPSFLFTWASLPVCRTVVHVAFHGCTQLEVTWESHLTFWPRWTQDNFGTKVHIFNLKKEVLNEVSWF